MTSRRDDTIRPVGVDEPSPNPPRLGVMVAAGVVVVILIGLGLGNRPPAPDAPDDNLPNVALIQLRVPDLLGHDIDEVESLMVSAGFEQGLPAAVRWVANDLEPAGRVVQQTPAVESIVAPDALLTLEISAGGPIATLFEVPAYAQQLVGPTFNTTESILVTQTSAGPAYKTDALSFGSCAAVEAAARHYRDVDFETTCPDDDGTSVTGWLLDGTAFIVEGLPRDRYVPDGTSGTIMVDLPDGTSQALGLSRFSHLPFPSPPSSIRTVNLLTISAGPWRQQVVLGEPLMVRLADEGFGELDGSITPWVADGYLVVDLRAPLRLQTADENVTSVVGISYGDISVQAGCWAFPATICDPSESISVTLPDTVSPADVSISVIGHGRWSRAEGAGWSIVHPDSWTLANATLTPNLASPAEVMSLSTSALTPGGEDCPHVPETALRQLGPSDVLISIYYHGPRDRARPHQFGDQSMPPLPAGDDLRQCSYRPDLDIRWDAFDFEGTGAFVLVAFGPDVDTLQKQAAWAILNSFEFTGQG